MSGEKLGINNLKEAAIGVINLGEKIDQALEDRKISGMEAINISITAIPVVFNDIKNRKEIVAEFEDLDETEKQDLIDTVAAELDLNNDYAERKIEAGFKVIVAFGEFLSIKPEEAPAD